jgi:DNA-binding response OmpR family regulator
MRPLRVVIVDDEVDTCAFLEAVFIAEGHLCTSFRRASDAERHLLSHRADLAMVDVYLGGENGIDLLRRLIEI